MQLWAVLSPLSGGEVTLISTQSYRNLSADIYRHKQPVCQVSVCSVVRLWFWRAVERNWTRKLPNLSYCCDLTCWNLNNLDVLNLIMNDLSQSYEWMCRFIFYVMLSSIYFCSWCISTYTYLPSLLVLCGFLVFVKLMDLRFQIKQNWFLHL